jgi:hypothetical protein
MNSTHFGIVIDVMGQSLKTCDSIRVNRDFDSNATDERNWQLQKHSEQIVSTQRGIMIDFSRECENVSLSIRVMADPDSNEIDKMHLQYEKHEAPIT